MSTLPRVLVVDDDALVLAQVLDALRPGGLSVSTASSAREALARLVSEAPYDFILSDVQMPEMDGFEFRQRVQQSPRIATIPFCFLTSSVRAEDKARARQMGARAFLRKPVHAPTLLRFVHEVLDAEPPPLVSGYLEPELSMLEALGPDALLEPILDLGVGTEDASTGLFVVCRSCGKSYNPPDEMDDDRLLSTCADCLRT